MNVAMSWRETQSEIYKNSKSTFVTLSEVEADKSTFTTKGFDFVQPDK